MFLPCSWRPSSSALLPANPATYDGPRLAVWGTALYLVIITVRSLVHLLAPDGGAQSIATIDVSAAGGSNIVALFGQWGAIQLLLAGLLWVLVLRWRGLVPLVLAVFAAEPCLRGLAGQLKPVTTMGAAPGAALNWLVLPGLAILLWLSLCPATRSSGGGRALGGDEPALNAVDRALDGSSRTGGRCTRSGSISDCDGPGGAGSSDGGRREAAIQERKR